MKVFLTLILSLILSSLFAQTCTSSGGDDYPNIDDEPYIFRCGNDRMYHHQKQAKDYKLIDACNNYWAENNYYIKDNQIYYSPEYGEFDLVIGANANSFRCEEGTAKDDKNIYYLGKKVEAVNHITFKSIGKLYCADNQKVYFKNKYTENGELTEVIKGKSKNFQLIGDSTSYYAKDDSSVYYYGKALVGADPNSFKVLEYGYAQDKNYAYYNDKRIEGLKGDGFKVLKDAFMGSDGISLCNMNNKIENSNATTFQIMECGYFKDKNHVYLNGSVLEDVDSESFKILSWGYTKDKNAVYCDLKLIEGANPATFEVLARKHAKDDKHIFYLQQKIDCDYTSFKIDTTLDYLSSDKNNQYSRGVVLNK